jgi:hypothetical protein
VHMWAAPGGSGLNGRALWSPDGTRIAYQQSNEVQFVDPDGGHALFFPEEGTIVAWTPDSRAVLVWVPDDGRLVTIDDRSGAASPIGRSRWYPVSFTWTRRASVYQDVDLCPRPGIFTQILDGQPRRVTNDCVIRGTARADRLFGTSLPDVLIGGGGNDKIYGLGGDDVLLGGRGNDSLAGDAGDDVAYGDAGDDTVSAETVFGGSGHDLLTLGTDPHWGAKAVRARDGQRDVIRCPLGQWPGPQLVVDRIDRIDPRCYGTSRD